MIEKDTNDAPPWYSAEEAAAWASGYNTASDLIERQQNAIAAVIRWANGLDNTGWPPPELTPDLIASSGWNDDREDISPTP